MIWKIIEQYDLGGDTSSLSHIKSNRGYKLVYKTTRQEVPTFSCELWQGSRLSALGQHEWGLDMVGTDMSYSEAAFS